MTDDNRPGTPSSGERRQDTDAQTQAAAIQAERDRAAEQRKRLEQKISFQRHEIKNRLVEISNLLGFKRNIERNVALHCPDEYKRRPFGGIEWLGEREREHAAELERLKKANRAHVKPSTPRVRERTRQNDQSIYT